MSSPGRRSAIGLASCRIAIVALSLTLGAVSTGSTLRRSWSFLSLQRESYADLTRDDPNVVLGFQTLLPVSVANFFSARVRPGERFYVQVGDGPFISGVDYPTAVRTFTRFELLPAIAVSEPRDAEFVLSVGVDPRLLGLSYERVERAPDERYTLARVRR